MGRAIAFVFFFVAFIIFAVIKAAFFGVKKAYKAVFDPNSDDEKIRKIVATCGAGVIQVMAEHYDGNPESLPGAINALTPMVQSAILEHGYQITGQIAREIVKESIIINGFATKEEVLRATA